MPPRLRPAADAASLLLLLLLAGYVGVVNGHYSYDDAFITFRMAENFAAGAGFVYNPGEWHLGSTAAFYGLTLGVLHRLGLPVPAAAGAISTMSLLATGWMLYGLGRLGNGALQGLLAGIFYVASPMIFVTFGGEMPFQIALITGAFFALQVSMAAEGRHAAIARTAAAVLAALAILTRPDGVLAAGVLFAYDVLMRRRIPRRELIVGALIVLPFVALGWYAYGSPLPSTLSAKLAQRDSGLWSSYRQGLFDWLRLFLWDDRGPDMGFKPVAPLTLAFWAFLGCVTVWRHRVFWPLLAWAVLFVAAYSLLGVPFYHWYAAPAVLAVAIAAGCGLGGLADALAVLQTNFSFAGSKARRALPASPYHRVAQPLLAVVAAVAISSRPLLALPETSKLNPTVNLYIHVGKWLDVNTPPESSVGYYEIGYIGFYGHRRMIDSLGLIDPDIAPAVARRDFVYAFREARPDFILEKRGAGLNGFLTEPWFTAEYRQRAILTIGRSSEAVIVHERIASPPAAGSSRALPPQPR